MKRERYYDFLWYWINTEKGHEFENKSKEYLNFLIKGHSEINNWPDRPSDLDFNNYKQGTLSILKDAIDAIREFLDYDEPQKNYLAYFLAIRNKYHNIYLHKDNEYIRGQHRASSDLYKGLTNLTQSMIEFELKRLPEAISEKTQFIPL